MTLVSVDTGVELSSSQGEEEEVEMQPTAKQTALKAIAAGMKTATVDRVQKR